MKTREIFNSRIPRLLKTDAVTLYPFIFYRFKKGGVRKTLRAHEMKHISDIREIGFFRFYISYLLYFLAGIIRFGAVERAYLKNPFEIRAYSLPSKNLSK